MSANTLRRSGLALALFGALGLAASRPTLAQSSFQFTNFDGPGDHAGGTTVNGINNEGDEVGFSANADASALTNFIRNGDGTFSILNVGAATAMANAINSRKTVVGGSGSNAFLLAKGMLTTLPPAN